MEEDLNFEEILKLEINVLKMVEIEINETEANMRMNEWILSFCYIIIKDHYMPANYVISYYYYFEEVPFLNYWGVIWCVVFIIPRTLPRHATGSGQGRGAHSTLRSTLPCCALCPARKRAWRAPCWEIIDFLS